MKLVNKLTGKELASGEWQTLAEALESLNPDYDEDTDCLSFDSDKYGNKIWHSYFDIAYECEMSYREYKAKYSKLRTKKDSYDPATKTIVVYMQDEA